MLGKINVYNASGWYQRVDPVSGVCHYSATPCFSTPSVIDRALQVSVWCGQSGAFAELLINPLTGEMVLTRDHFGCQPFYYFFDGRRLVFGSNLPDVLRHLPQSPEFNTAELLALFSGTQVYSDETFYRTVQRVEPGCILYFRPGCQYRKTYFWQLDKNAEDLVYAKDSDYLDNFSELLHESVKFNTKTTGSLAAELSGGLDSSAILVTAHQQGIHYPLFMHVANPGSDHVDDQHLAKDLLKQLQLTDVNYIGADQFDPIAVLRFCAQHFSGVAPYLFFMLANNIHSAVAAAGHNVLLSGAAGDECVSGHAWHGYFPQLLKRRHFSQAWSELIDNYQVKGMRIPSIVRRAEVLLKSFHPVAYRELSKLESVARIIKNYFQNKEQSTHISVTRRFYPSVRACEWDMLQGPRSHETRMRVEYSAVIAKAMGFEYRYPLLYPKLVDFCFRLPINQKRRHGEGRYLIRRYLEQHAPYSVYSKQQKVGGILPATVDKCQHYLAEGRFHTSFNEYPGLDQIEQLVQADQGMPHQVLIRRIHAYMLKCALDNKSEPMVIK